jgi:hypothetical protein
MPFSPFLPRALPSYQPRNQQPINICTMHFGQDVTVVLTEPVPVDFSR